MKVRELLEQRDDPFTLQQHDFDSLPAVSPSNIEDRFKVGPIAFDQAKGLGANPNNQNVVYLGFAVEMKPSDFLKLALPGDREDDANKFVKFAKALTPMASPTLYVDVNDDKFEDGEPLRVVVTSHEGRGRMTAIRKMTGDKLIPVHFILNKGLRARHLSAKFFDALRERGIVSERDKHDKQKDPTQIELGRVFWNSEQL